MAWSSAINTVIASRSPWLLSTVIFPASCLLAARHSHLYFRSRAIVARSNLEETPQLLHALTHRSKPKAIGLGRVISQAHAVVFYDEVYPVIQRIERQPYLGRVSVFYH